MYSLLYSYSGGELTLLQELEPGSYQVGRNFKTAGENNIDFDFDPNVSRLHAELSFADDSFSIKDSRSKNGTLLQSEALTDQWRPLPFGAPVRTGKTTWFIIKKDCFLFFTGGLIVHGSCNTLISYVDFHCSLPLVKEVQVTNISGQAGDFSLLQLELPNYIEKSSVPLPALQPSQSKMIKNIHPAMCFDSFAALHDLAKGSLTISLLRPDGTVLASTRHPVTLLGLWSWRSTEENLKEIGAYLLPANSVVGEVYTRAREWAATDTSPPDQASGAGNITENTAQHFLPLIYNFLRDNSNLVYTVPSVIRLSEKTRIQNILSPQVIFSDLATLNGKAGCFEITLLIGALLEKEGIPPVVILTGEHEKNFEHAMIGCWSGVLPGGRPVIKDKDFILKQVDEGYLQIVDGTGVASVQESSVKKPYDESVQEARSIINNSACVQAVDVFALRPPFGSVLPLEFNFDTAVSSAYYYAEQYRTTHHLPKLDLILLFAGIAKSGGPALCALLKKSGLPSGGTLVTTIEEQLTKLAEDETYLNFPKQTMNYNLVRIYAQQIARFMGKAIVGEDDLIYAFLHISIMSENLVHFCRRLGINLAVLKNNFEELFPKHKKAYYNNQTHSIYLQTNKQDAPGVQ